MKDVRLKATDKDFDNVSFAFMYVVQPLPSISSSLTMKSIVPEPGWFATRGNDCVKAAIAR